MKQPQCGNEALAKSDMVSDLDQARVGDLELQKARRDERSAGEVRAEPRASSGSPNKIAQIADASTTLTGIAGRPHYASRLGWRLDAEARHFGHDLAGGHRSRGSHGFFQDGEQLPLQ